MKRLSQSTPATRHVGQERRSVAVEAEAFRRGFDALTPRKQRIWIEFQKEKNNNGM